MKTAGNIVYLANGGWLRFISIGEANQYNSGGLLTNKHLFPAATNKKYTLTCMRELAREIDSNKPGMYSRRNP